MKTHGTSETFCYIYGFSYTWDVYVIINLGQFSSSFIAACTHCNTMLVLIRDLQAAKRHLLCINKLEVNDNFSSPKIKNYLHKSFWRKIFFFFFTFKTMADHSADIRCLNVREKVFLLETFKKWYFIFFIFYAIWSCSEPTCGDIERERESEWVKERQRGMDEQIQNNTRNLVFHHFVPNRIGLFNFRCSIITVFFNSIDSR